MRWSGEVDEFKARGGGLVVTIIVRQTISSNDVGGSEGLIHGAPSYTLRDGSEVEKLDSRRFRIVATGQVVERIG